MQNDLVEVLEASVEGRLSEMELRWSSDASVCVVMVSEGYPGAYAKDKIISGLAEAGRLSNTKIFHAGTARSGGSVVTAGGRVLGVTSWAGNVREARNSAYGAVSKIRFDGAHYRRDIGAKALS
jgi:phosphoribosylamine--glycine ligase